MDNKIKAVTLLKHDIRNCVHHVYGNHSQCSDDFCKSKGTKAIQNDGQTINEVNDEEDLISEQCSLWSDGTSIEEQENSRTSSGLTNKDLSMCSTMLSDIVLILNRLADKSSRLLGNTTTNLAECWMHIRSKFGGGKIFNLCNRGSWFTRCYTGALRFNLGPRWSAIAWQKGTASVPGAHFTKLYQDRLQNLANCSKAKAKPSSIAQRYKRNMSIAKTNESKKAKLLYGPNALDITPDLTCAELENQKEAFLQRYINISAEAIDQLQKDTLNQSSQFSGNKKGKRD